MKKRLLIIPLLAWTFSVFGQNDSIVLADYEANSQYPNRTSGWNNNLGLTIGVDNPLKDAVNPSEKVISMHLTKQWDHAIVLDNFIEPISLAMFPNFKVKVLSDSAVSKKVGINLTDINGFTVYMESTLPSDVNTKWADVLIDFSGMLTSTPVSFIQKVEIMIDRGTGDPAVGNVHNKYFVDDIEFKGPKATITESDTLPVYSESFSDNGWWGTGGGAPMMNTIEYYRSAQWGGSALSALAKFYTLSDSLGMAMDGWSGKTCAYFFPHATRPALSQLSIKDLNVEGLQNLTISYNMNWVSDPASWTDAPTVEYSNDGTTWIAVATSSTLPTGSGTWVNNVQHKLTGVTAKNILVRITNNTTGAVMIDELKLTGSPVFANTVAVYGTDNVSEISIDNGTLQMTDTISPLNAAQDVIWSVENGTGMAEISETGLLTAVKNGTVTVKARAKDIWGTKVGEKVITLSNQIYQPVWKELNVATKVDTTNISSKSDFSVFGKITWDNKYIYLKLNVIDDSIYAEGEQSTWERDNIEIYFDMNNTKAALPERGIMASPSYDTLPGAYQLRLIPGVPFDSINNTRKGWAIQEYQVTDTGYTYDLMFSIDSLLKGYVPKVGNEIGFDILASDNDNDPYYRDQLSFYSPSATVWCDAAMWGTLKFAENGSFTQVFDVTKPSVVSNLKAKQDVKNVLLTWDAATDNIVVEKYVVYADNVKVSAEYAVLTDNSYLVENVAPGEHTFSVSALDIAGNESDKVDVTLTTVGVNHASTIALNIFPNPSADLISINNENTVKMEIFNAAGQIVIVKSVNAGEKINIASLSNGIYSVRVLNNNNVSVLKLIKK